MKIDLYFCMNQVYGYAYRYIEWQNQYHNKYRIYFSYRMGNGEAYESFIIFKEI